MKMKTYSETVQISSNIIINKIYGSDLYALD